MLGAEPGVDEVAVVGVDDPDTGEALVAYVVAGARRRSWTQPSLIQAASRSLARFKLPRFVEIVDALPHTAPAR